MTSWTAELEDAIARLSRDGDRAAFVRDLQRLGFDDEEIARWLEELSRDQTMD